MPTIDEQQAQRQTYGEAAGWGEGQRAVAPEAAGVTPEGAPGASPAPDAETASSAVPDGQATESEPTPPTPEPDRKFNMPPPERWEELRRQREDAERRAQQAEQLAQLALSKVQTPSAPPADDHWKGLVDHPDPATAQFYQQQRALFQREAERMAEQKLQGVLQAVDAGRRELAEIKISQFRKENPEITPGSADETAIAGYVQQGFDLTAAKKLALFDKLEAENRALKTKQSAVPQKRAAATPDASAGIPQTAGLPPKPGDWRERASQIIDNGGGIREVAKAIFG